MRLLTLLILASFLFFSACQKAEKTKAEPVVLLTENQMVELVTDVQLLEAALNHRRNLGQNINELKLLWFNQLFEKHRLTDVVFEENIAYYNEQPAVMEQILEEVLANIIQEQARLKAVGPEKKSE